jgi:hypothetical protein
METTKNNLRTPAWNLKSVGNHLLSLPEQVLNVLAMGATEARNLIRLYRGKWFLYHPRPNDIFVVSYPKSGTTLMQMIVYQLATRGEADFSHITIVSPWFEMELMLGRPRGLEVPSPRIFKSHLRYWILPKVGRFIYMLRDPRDVALSAYHHQVMMTGERPRPEKFVHKFILGRIASQSWYTHLASWWPHRNDPNVLFLRYEEVVADLEGAVRRVAAFCGIEVREEDLPKILEHCGLDFMKRHQEKFDPRTLQVALNSGQFIREGKTGSGREVMTPETREILAEKLADLERRLGVPAQDPLSGVFRLQD